MNPGSRAGEGLWATGTTLKGQQIEFLPDAQALTDDIGTAPAPDPLLYVTYDGSQGPGIPGKPGGAVKQAAEGLVEKVKNAVS